MAGDSASADVLAEPCIGLMGALHPTSLLAIPKFAAWNGLNLEYHLQPPADKRKKDDEFQSLSSKV